ncbi:MAG: EamA family transporter [Lachnospiraceae bacterium]|nr:EamA family transporter [Lachnospiraceae bacterium]
MLQGILCIVGASLIFGILPTTARYLVISGLPPACVTFYTQGVLTLTAYIASKLRHESLRIERASAGRLLMLGAIGMGITAFLINTSTQYIPVGVATVIHFMYPTIVTIVMLTVFKQKATWFKLLAIICSITGLLLITNVKGSGGNLSLLGIVLAAGSSLTYSFYMISNEKAGFASLPLLTRLVYAGLGSTILFGIVSAATDSLRMPHGLLVWIILILINGVGNFTAHFLIVKGIRLIGASNVSFVNMLEPVASVIVSLIVYHDVLKQNMIFGIVLILSAVLLVAVDNKLIEARQAKEEQ